LFMGQAYFNFCEKLPPELSPFGPPPSKSKSLYAASRAWTSAMMLSLISV
jgi:hypothetical protein